MGLIQRIARSALRLLARRPIFASHDVVIGRDVEFGDDVHFACKRVRIGDGVRFGSRIRVECDDFEIGDHGTIYDDCFFPGPGRLQIGHNFWLGKGCIIDAQGGTTIGDNVGIGAGSQLWTHMKYGDVMAGCRFHGSQPLVIEDDAWLVGHCLVSPVHIGARSVAMLGSVVTRDLKPDHCYAGVPAEDASARFGSQFRETTPEERRSYLEARIEELSLRPEFAELRGQVRIVTRREDMADAGEGVTVFNVVDRTYTKQGSPLELLLLRALLPDAKFVPLG